MNSDRAQGRRYRLALRGELGEPFGFLFEGMQMELARHGVHTFWGLLTRTAATIAAHTLLRVCLTHE